MKTRQELIVPTLAPLPHGLRLPTSYPAVYRALSKLSRPSLVEVAKAWCAPANLPSCAPFVRADSALDAAEDAYVAADSIEDLLAQYTGILASRKGTTKRELIDRMLEGDWRHGLSLRQLAMVDIQSLADHPASLRWSAFYIKSWQQDARQAELKIPRIHAASFVLGLHQQVAALARIHYHVSRLPRYPITFVRLALFDTPYAHESIPLTPQVMAQSKTMFFAFPDGAPHVYISLSMTHQSIKESCSVTSFIIKAIPAALSSPIVRYDLMPTRLSASSLDALLAIKGPSGEAGVSGAWSIYADTQDAIHTLDFSIANSRCDTSEKDVANKDARPEPKSAKRTYSHAEPTAHLPPSQKMRLEKLASGRFGTIGTEASHKVLSQFQVKIQDTQSEIRVTFQGSNVFAGVRTLVEAGVIDGLQMPSWMTGEADCSVGTIKHGRLLEWDAEQ